MLISAPADINEAPLGASMSGLNDFLEGKSYFQPEFRFAIVFSQEILLSTLFRSQCRCPAQCIHLCISHCCASCMGCAVWTMGTSCMGVLAFCQIRHSIFFT